MTQFELRRLSAEDASDFRDIRLAGLASAPEAFGSSLEQEEGKPIGWYADRLRSGIVLGGFQGTTALMGVIGLALTDAPKTRHKGTIWGMFVRPAARGTGLAQALVELVIENARGLVEELRLTVVSSNDTAIRLYSRAGFVQYGEEPRALKIGDRYHNEILMNLSLDSRP